MSTADLVLAVLERYGLKKMGQGRYRCNSPFRPQSNSGAFALTIKDGEHGVYFDFVSKETGTLYDLAKRLGIEVQRGQSSHNPYYLPRSRFQARIKRRRINPRRTL